MYNNNISELNNLYAQINMMSGNSLSTTGFGQGMQSYNDVAWFAGAVGALGSDEVSAEQKASVVQGLVQKALSIFDKLASREAQAARKEVQKETKATQELLAKSNNLGAELNGSLTEIQSNIESQTAIVEDAQELLKETQKSIEDKQKQIEEIVTEIEKKQQELAAAATPEEQAAILAEIQGLATQIADIGITIETDSENLENLQAAVDDTTADIEASTQKMAETESAGIEQLASQAQEASNINTEIAQTSATGTTNKVTGEALEKSAEAASSNVFSGTSIAPKLYQAANDQNMASTTRLTSIASNVNTLAQGIGGLSNAAQVLSTFQNSIGGALNNYAVIVGEWDTAVEPVITSLGSFANVATGVEELNQSVETDLGTIGYSVNEEGEVEPSEDKKEEQPEQQEKESKSELETPKFDTQKLRTFGI